MKTLFFALVILTSCTRKAGLINDGFNTKVKDVTMDISQLVEIPWWIGATKKEDKVTQSITFLLDLPRLREEDLEFLAKNKEVDSWIVRVIQNQGPRKQDLGSVLVPFFPRQHGRSTSKAGIDVTAIKIYYAAAYASERMRAFKCPAFGHDKRIKSMAIKGENTPFEISLGAGRQYREKSQEARLTASSFNGGNSLQAEYHLEIAPYTSKKLLLLGDFKRIPRYVEVIMEAPVNVVSCLGARPEFN